MIQIVILSASPDSPEARACVHAYIAELAQRFEAGFDPGAPTPEEDAAFAAPHGVFLLAWRAGEAIG